MENTPNIDYGLRRFVVLHHTGIESAHFDFMFDTGDQSQLVTFRVAQWPLLQSQPASKLRDHRRAYLSFQGAIPGDRGQVHRVDEGQILVTQTPSGWLLRRSDGRPRLELQPMENQAINEQNWWISLPPDPATD